jgi:hypothetical protein
MKTYSKETLACINDEKDKLRDEIRKCDFCSSSIEEHGGCYEEAARVSGRRSRECFN